MGTFKTHNVDGVSSDSDEDKPHGVEIERTPVMLDEHVGITSEEDNEIDLLGLIANSYDVLIGQDLQQ